MRLKDVFYGLGIQPAAREFPFEVRRFTLPKDGEVEFACWRHPAEKDRRFSQAEVDAVRAFVAPGDFAVDIGAHIGDTALPMGLAAGPQGGVLALEPNPYVFKILSINAGLNRGKARIFPLMFAAMPEDGEFEFRYSDPGFCNGGWHRGVNRWRHGHFFRLKVQGRNLAAYLKRAHPEKIDRLRYIKIDTEGLDREVVLSLREVLAASRPYLKTEIYKHMPHAERLGYYHELVELGYRLYKFENEENYQGPELGERDLMRWAHYDVFAVPA